MKVIIVTLVTIWFSCVLNCNAQEDINLKKAAGLLKAHKTGEARQVLNKVIKADPSNSKALHLLGKIYLEEHNYKLACLFLKQAITKSVNPDPEHFIDLGEALQLSHNFGEAKEQFEAALGGLGSPKSKSDKFILAKVKATLSRKINECEVGAQLVSDPLEVRISNLGSTINTVHSEYHPLATADNMQLFFTGKDGPFDGDARESIFRSQNRAPWEKAVPFELPIDFEKGEACAGISPDGQTLFLTRNVNGGDLFISELKDGVWAKPKPFPYNSSRYEGSVHVSADGKKLLFVSDRAKSKDIYLCVRSGNGWGKPVKLGSGINTSEDEESPWLDADGRFLYFSSKGHTTMGGYDIFKVTLSGANADSEVINIGYPINSAADDLYFMLLPDGKSAYYSSEKDGGFGNQDIYSIQMSVARQGQLALFKGTIAEITGQPIDAQVLVTDIETGMVVAKLKANPQTGTFLTMLALGRKYTVLAEKEGFLFYSDILDLETNEKNADLNRDIKMQKLQPGVTIVLNNVFFDPGKSSLKKESSPELLRIVQILRQNPNIRVEIGSHMEGQASEELNQKISENRAQAIVDYLVVTGIKSSRLVAKGYGSSKPLSENRNDRSRQQNRRTEFKVLNVM